VFGPNARYIVLVAGILGTLSLFQPLISMGRYKLSAEFSAYELSFKSTDAHRLLDAKLPKFVERKLSADILQTRDDIKMIVDASKNAAYAFIPSILLLVIGIVAFKRKRLGRPLAALAVLFGLASAAAYVGLKYGIFYGEQEEPIVKRLNLQLQIGAKVLLAGGLGAAIFALVALIKGEAAPEPAKSPPAPRK
jgi:hypothetical protein